MHGTTAATTKFAHYRLDVGGGEYLFMDGNSKITAWNGTFDEPVANAFSTVQVKDCPGSTPSCRATCYVNMLEKFQPDVHAMYRHNSEAIRRVLRSSCWRESIWLFGEYIRDQCPGGFRWHVSGDVFSADYAYFLSRVVEYAWKTAQWIYTRSFEHVGYLLGVSTLRGGPLEVNLSADVDNYTEARRLATRHGLRVCYMTLDGTVPDDLRDGDVVFPDYALRGIGDSPGEMRDASAFYQGLSATARRGVCPVDFYGKSDEIRCGPCGKCLPVLK